MIGKNSISVLFLPVTTISKLFPFRTTYSLTPHTQIKSPYNIEQEINSRIKYNERMRQMMNVNEPMWPFGQDGAAFVLETQGFVGRRDESPDVTGHEERHDAQ